MKFLGILICVVLCLGAAPVRAENSVPLNTSVYSVDAETGLVLFEHNANIVRPPASTIKLMLMFLVAEGIERGDWSLDTPIETTRKAQRMGGTQVFLHAGEVHTLRALMLAVAVASANDAAMAVAEGLWGTEEAYLAAMNLRAVELGMATSEFHSVHGLPPDRGEQPDRTTARDMALLARAAVQHAQVIEWTNTVSFEMRPGKGKAYTTNTLMRQMPECDGLKTGFISASGFCICATATRGDIRVVSVVMGHPEKQGRFDLAESLLLDGLDSLIKAPALTRETADAPAVPVRNAEATELTLAIPEDLWVTVKKQDWQNLNVVYSHPEYLVAPLTAGVEVGEVRVELGDEVLARTALRVPEDIIEVGWKTRFGRAVDDFFSVAD